MLASSINEMNYNAFHAFQYDNDFYIFDIKQLYYCTIEKEFYENLLNNEVCQEKSQKKLLEYFESRKVFFYNIPKEEYVLSYPDSIIISLALTHRCNLACKYCFANSGRNQNGAIKSFTINSINQLIDFLLHDPYFSQITYFRFNLVGGGEPLIDKKLLLDFVKITSERFNKAHKHLYIWFATNGTLLTLDILSELSRYNIGYGISLDGELNVNDACRVYPSGKGTFEDINNNINKIKKSTLPSNMKELWGLMVCTNYNHNWVDSLLQMKEMGFSTVQMRFVRTKDDTLLVNEAQLLRNAHSLIDKLFYTAINGDISLLCLICNDNDYFGKIVKRIILNMISEVRCGAGSCMFSIAADGKIYPCDSFVGDNNYVIGDIYNGFIEHKLNRYRDLSIFKRPLCRTCWARYVCGGDCYHNSLLSSGNMLIPDALFCKVIKCTTEQIIARCNSLRKINPKSFDALKRFLFIRERLSQK